MPPHGDRVSPPVSTPALPQSPWTGGLPTTFELSAAARVIRLLAPDGTPISTARGSYRRHVSGGLFTTTDLITGERLLTDLGVLVEREGVLYLSEDGITASRLPDADARELLLARLLEDQPPVWFRGAVDLDGAPAMEYVPDAARRTLRELFGTDDLTAAFLTSRVTKVDAARNAETGELAEEHVAAEATAALSAAGQADLAKKVHRVSRYDDSAGYDVTAPRLDQTVRHLEVKGTRATTSLRVVLSRNEAERGQADPNWALVVCRVAADGSRVDTVGWCGAQAFEGGLPHDVPGRARWQSAALTLQLDDLEPGLPPHTPPR